VCLVEESKAARGATLTYRIEHRPIRQPAWEPVDASVTIVGESEPVLSLKTNRNMLAINSFSTPDSGVGAELVDVGKGTPADYARRKNMSLEEIERWLAPILGYDPPVDVASTQKVA